MDKKFYWNYDSEFFFLFFIFYAQLTTLPMYTIDILNRTTADAGLVVTVFLLASLFVTPLSGKILEVIRKETVLILLTLLFLMTTVLYIWITGFFHLLILRFFHGVWFGIATTVTGTIAAELVPPARRAEGLGYFAMSMNLAVVAGPFTALTLLQTTSFEVMFVVLPIIMILGTIFSINVKVPPLKANSQSIKKQKLKIGNLFERKVIPIALVGGILAFCYSGVISFISIYAQQKNLTAAAANYFLVSAVAMLVSRPFVGRIFDAKGHNVVVYPAFILFSFGLLTLSYANTPFIFLLSGVLIGTGYGSLIPCLQTMAIQLVSPERYGYSTATYFTFFDGGLALGSFVLGITVGFIGYETLYFLVSLLVIIVLLLFKYVLKNKFYSKSNF